MEQLDGSSQEYIGIGMAPALDTGRTSGLEHRDGSVTLLRSGVDPCQRSSLSSLH